MAHGILLAIATRIDTHVNLNRCTSLECELGAVATALL